MKAGGWVSISTTSSDTEAEELLLVELPLLAELSRDSAGRDGSMGCATASAGFSLGLVKALPVPLGLCAGTGLITLPCLELGGGGGAFFSLWADAAAEASRAGGGIDTGLGRSTGSCSNESVGSGELGGLVAPVISSRLNESTLSDRLADCAALSTSPSSLASSFESLESAASCAFFLLNGLATVFTGLCVSTAVTGGCESGTAAAAAEASSQSLSTLLKGSCSGAYAGAVAAEPK